MDNPMELSMDETDLESQTSAQQHSPVRFPSSPTIIEYDNRASFKSTNPGRRHEKYRELPPVEPFSSYRNSASMPQPIDDYPNEICAHLDCWQTAVHQHTIEELQYLMDKTRARFEQDPSSGENEDQVQKQRKAWKIEKKPMKPRSSRGRNGLADGSVRMSRELRRALPDNSEFAAQASSGQAELAQLLVNRPPSRTFTLALRPMPSRQEQVEADAGASGKLV